MAMNRKGVFFTFVAVFLIVIILVFITARERYGYREKGMALYARVNTINNFIDDLDEDMVREVFIGGYRALLSMNSHIRDTESFVPDFDSTFTEIFTTGMINGTQMELMEQGTQGADFTSWLARINEEASALNIEVASSINRISVVHTSPWDILIIVNASFNITDNKGLAHWELHKEYVNGFSIVGFEDPLYIVGTDDKVTSLVNRTLNIDFVDDATNDTTVLSQHVNSTYYLNDTAAPSFLMRFTGNLSPSPYGIESFVNVEELMAQGRPRLPMSLIDYIYFGNQSTTDYCNVAGMPEWFRIDNGHISLYEVDKLAKSTC